MASMAGTLPCAASATNLFSFTSMRPRISARGVAHEHEHDGLESNKLGKRGQGGVRPSTPGPSANRLPELADPVALSLFCVMPLPVSPRVLPSGGANVLAL